MFHDVYFWVKRLKVWVTNHKHAGVGLCTNMSAGFFTFSLASFPCVCVRVCVCDCLVLATKLSVHENIAFESWHEIWYNSQSQRNQLISHSPAAECGIYQWSHTNVVDN